MHRTQVHEAIEAKPNQRVTPIQGEHHTLHTPLTGPEISAASSLNRELSDAITASTPIETERKDMKQEYRQAINAMRDEGYLVIIWTPEELGDIAASHVEDMLIERGNDMIEQLQGEA